MGIVTAATHPFCSMQSDLFYEFNQFENSFFFLFGRRSYTHIYIYFQDVEKNGAAAAAAATMRNGNTMWKSDMKAACDTICMN